MTQPSDQPRWTDDEMVEALTAPFLSTRTESNPDRWAKSKHEDVREWSAAFLALQSAAHLGECDQLAVRRQFTAVVGHIRNGVTAGSVPNDDAAWLRRQLAWLGVLPS